MNVFKTNTGDEIGLLSNAIKSGLSIIGKEKTKSRKIKYASYGSLSPEGMQAIENGFEVLRRVLDEIIENKESDVLLGNIDVPQNRSAIIRYRYVINNLFNLLENNIRIEKELKEKINGLHEKADIYQAARDGVLTTKIERSEMVNGTEQKVAYDTTITPSDARDIFRYYETFIERHNEEKLNNYLGLGLAIIGLIGSLQKIESKQTRILTIGTIAVSGIKTIKELLNDKGYNELWDLIDKEQGLTNDLNSNEPISNQDSLDQIETIRNVAIKKDNKHKAIKNRSKSMDILIDIIVAIITGAYIKNQVEIKENGQFDGKALAQAYVSLQSVKGIAGTLINTIEGFRNSIKNQAEYKEALNVVKDIMTQMEEKVYPLQGAKDKFDSILIKNFKGCFYPRTNYLTGKTNFEHTIQIDEFSISKGDVVLLSGNSGSGKSTFLRFLKRGDINNTGSIKLDFGKNNERTVDSLGNQYISYRPKFDFGDESSALFQIARKESVSKLEEKRKNKLLRIIRELHIYDEATPSEEILDDLATKRFQEYSTGQQNRLALAKLLYRINNKISIIIVDEPAGNVEDKLIMEQLEIIKKFAIKHELMLLLVTHRVDLAEKLVTKRYNIKKGVLSEIPISQSYDTEKVLGEPIE